MGKEPAAAAKKRTCGTVLLAVCGLGLTGCASGLFHSNRVDAVVPGMTQTELQSVLGPPDYIQAKDLRQAWQYCPHLLDIRDRLYITVWLDDGHVEHLRAYADRVMGSCEDFLAAFRWEDIAGRTKASKLW
ncbi:MAG TPA: hypothetical protein VJ045_10755 [Hyphomicrobiaceae bacterium]|nr:hypothetical protein [Hyphomicrobiaceae bacterium]